MRSGRGARRGVDAPRGAGQPEQRQGARVRGRDASAAHGEGHAPDCIASGSPEPHPARHRR